MCTEWIDAPILRKSEYTPSIGAVAIGARSQRLAASGTQPYLVIEYTLLLY